MTVKVCINGQDIIAMAGDREIARGHDASAIITDAIRATPDKGDVLISAGLYDLSADTLFYLDPGEKNPFWVCIATYGKNIHIRGEGPGKTVLRLKPKQHYPDHPVAMVLAGPESVFEYGHTDFVLEGITFDGNRAKQKAYLKDGAGCVLMRGDRDHGLYRNLEFLNSHGTGLYLGNNGSGSEDLASVYNNLFMTLITNGKDNEEKDLAGARAGQEAVLRLGTSPAVDDNSLKGIQGLLFQWNDADREVLNAAGLEVLVKETGVHPYVGVTTNLDDSFYRTVDVRTICATIIVVDQIVKKFMNERRTQTNLARMQASIDVVLNRYKASGVLDTYTLAVTPNEADHNAVDIALKIQPVGHIERVQTWMGVGYYDSSAIAEV